MKKQVTKTVVETQVLCDVCAKECVYSTDDCIVCGKSACHDCFDKTMVRLELNEFPRFYGRNCSMPTFYAVACVTCENELTRRFAKLKTMRDRANAKCRQWHSSYLAEIKALLEMQRKIEKERGVA